ncbi:hypothetical protein NIES4074_28690 [Cylindrospermum sp. NIES-4074]|nr:hypothetical protein NIES4074_28690 [Cylindrospermum sp. NIES-4074]
MTPTLLPKTFTVPPVAPETLRLPEATATPPSLGIVTPELVSTTCPALLTVTPVAIFAPPPVKSCGRVRGLIPEVAVLGSISKLSKFPGCDIRTKLDPGTAAMVIFPCGAVRVPVLMTLPPSKVRFCPVATCSEPALMMLPG